MNNPKLKPIYALTIATVTFGFGVATPLTAEEKKKKAGPGNAEKKGGGEFFAKMDKDGDKAISKEEAGRLWERLSRLDKNEDGKVTGPEMMAGRGSAPGAKGGPGSGELFQKADKNQDGKITKDEVPEGAWEKISLMDRNKDEAVSKEEAAAAARHMAAQRNSGGAQLFEKADKNKDGRISKDEVPEEAWGRIGKADKNGDGAITKEEMQAAHEGMRKKAGAEGGMKRPEAGGGGNAEAIFGKMDKNQDSKLSKDEVPAELWARISRADEDADGNVSKKELQKVYSQRSGGGMMEEKKPEGSSKKSGGKKPKRPELES